jgi:hypothetical protein
MERPLRHPAQYLRDAVVSNSKAVPRLRVIELSGDFSEKAASGAVVVQDPIHGFLDRLLDGDLFECAVVVAKKGLLSRKDQTAWPLVIVGADDAKRARVDLEKIARAGFQLIVGTKSSLRDLETVFEALGYRKAGQGTYADGDAHDPVQAAWEKEAFLRAIAVATKLCDHALCVLAHDGDPVYLLAK